LRRGGFLAFREGVISNFKVRRCLPFGGVSRLTYEGGVPPVFHGAGLSPF